MHADYTFIHEVYGI